MANGWAEREVKLLDLHGLGTRREKKGETTRPGKEKGPPITCENRESGHTHLS